MKETYLILILFLTLGSCGVPSPGSHDFTTHLQNGYKIFRSSAHEVKIVPEGGWSNETPIIPTIVLKLNIHNEFVIAYRQGLKERDPNNPDDGYMIPDPDKFDYWILDTAKPKSYSKMTKKELKIPQSLKLIDVYEF